MPRKFCTGCWELFDKGQLHGGRCGRCRGSRQARGVGGPDYDGYAKMIRDEGLRCQCRGECGWCEGGKTREVCDYPPGNPKNPITVGHIVPRVAGGSNEWHNLRPECRSCNLRKGGR